MSGGGPGQVGTGSVEAAEPAQPGSDGDGPIGDGPDLRLVRGGVEIRDLVRARRRAGRTVGFVPTMGWLHEGHLSLVDLASVEADEVVVSVFVNPTQFGPEEDYEEYPRDLARDARLAAERGAALLFAPSVEEIYPREQRIWVEPGPLAGTLCGASRPGHFRGVLTVVLKLFHLVEPDVAVFGRKDFQQAVLVRRMTEELNLPIRIVTGPVVREADGLAMSSRNEYLDPAGRATARSLSRALRRVRGAVAAGVEEPAELEAMARETMEAAGARVEYARIVRRSDLARPGRVTGDEVCAVAAGVGNTRLIDNAPVTGPSTLDELEGEG